MTKHLPLYLLVAACFSGCAAPVTPAFINNPRVVERDLGPQKPQALRKPVERQLRGGDVPVAGGGVVALPTAASVPGLPKNRWEVRVSDVRLAATFERWAAEATAAGRESYKILWDAEKHVLIDATPVYGGSMIDAVEAALSTPAIRRSAYPLEACLYPNETPLIRITKRGEQIDACPEVK